MDGQMFGDIVSGGLRGMFKTMGCLITLIFLIGGVAVVLGIYAFSCDTKTIKVKERPIITWELKAKGQKVDTIWIYKFK
jgi:competence protein ComGF